MAFIKVCGDDSGSSGVSCTVALSTKIPVDDTEAKKLHIIAT